MKQPTMYIPLPTPALSAAARHLKGYGVTFTEAAEDAEYLLYPAPTKLEMLPECTMDHTVIGGGLDFLNERISRIDLFRDPGYLAANAAITAEAALGLILQALRREITQANILILGWGRIGKCLTHQLHHLNARVTVYARRESDRSLLRALGYRPISRSDMGKTLGRYHCIVNTVPAPVLTEDEGRTIRPGCIRLELASGIRLPGNDVTVAHGLPGKCKPEASGALIARTVAGYLGGSL
ncbi:MAG: hypothetical protein IKD27_02880 [Oscillospiraceae bacterium]|nr:hypothetical protein [Oscillospiraceae bacterium]